MYRVALALESGLPPKWSGQSWRGKVTIHARWESPGWRYFRQALAVFIRELGF
jgi:putative peptide zinc metalloprotease protein